MNSGDKADKGPRASTAKLIRTVYVSAAVKPFDAPALRQLLLRAREHNSGVDISGLMLYKESSFFQILEGPEDEVNSLFLKIERDSRHHKIMLLSKEVVKSRNFGDWSMGYVELDAKASKLPGFIKLLDAKASFLDLQGDRRLTARLLDGFQDGLWRQGVEK